MTKPHKITEIFAWIVTHPSGEEGIPAIDGGNNMALPLIGSDRERIESFRAHAMAVCGAHGMPVKLCKFTDMVVLEEHEPKRMAGSA